MTDPKRREYLDQLKTFLREQHSDLVAKLSDRRLEARITFGIEKAELYDLTSAYAVTRFVSMMFSFRPISTARPKPSRFSRMSRFRRTSAPTPCSGRSARSNGAAFSASFRFRTGASPISRRILRSPEKHRVMK
jgi:hypothetical protein